MASSGGSSNDEEQKEALLVGFDPLQHYVQELNQVLGHLCCFFVDRLRPKYIGVVYRRAIVGNVKTKKNKKNAGSSNNKVSTGLGTAVFITCSIDPHPRKDRITVGTRTDAIVCVVCVGCCSMFVNL